MTIQSKTLAQLVTDAATAIQGAASALVDMSVGSVLRAFIQAAGGIGMWLQAIALQILARSRLSSSSGNDVDTWLADFGFAREGAVAATGPETFARLTSTTQAVVPVGTIVQTEDGSVTYAVIADAAQAAYSASSGGYVLSIGTTSITATIQCQTTGSGGNAAAGAINTLGSTIAGIDSVTNAAAFENGEDAELDPAVKTRFVAWLNTLSKATKAAVGAATDNVQNGVAFNIVENQNFDGTANDGYFYLVVDDGSGSPSETFISTVYNAIDAVRPLTVTFGVFPPIVVTANVAMTITIAAGYQTDTVLASVRTAQQVYINTLGLGVGLPYTRLAQIAYDASPGVVNVAEVTLNGASADLTATGKQVIKAGTVTASAAA